MVLFMPMKREDHEKLLGELLNPELEQSRKTEILQDLRTDYGSTLVEFDESKTKIEKLTHDKEDLTLANSKLFRQIGITGTEDEKREEKKEFSETVTLEEIEKRSQN
jgi:regulator of replication initiation timing